MSGKHGKPLRGLMSTKTSPLFQGYFGRMFPHLKAAKFGKNPAETSANLALLAEKMSAGSDPLSDAPDAEESGIPALYTYLGQFIDHDITFDPSGMLQKEKDPDALVDFRTPAFDLDNVYGRGPDDQPYLYDGDKLFLLGDPIAGGGDPNARDLPRNGAPKGRRRALIGDPRNDENTIVSQLQGLFLRFHNRVVAEHPHADFPELQQIVRMHYQYVVLHDFLPRIVHSDVLAALKTGGHYDPHKLKFYHFRNEPFMPVEFSVAAYRLGHSMIRPGYRLNDAPDNRLPIFPAPGDPPTSGLTGFGEMDPNRGIDWGRFIDIDIRDSEPAGKTNRLQFAYRIDTSAVNPLRNLPASVVSDFPPSLPLRNLIRGLHLGLPSGQSVAHAMGVKVLHDDEILLGKFVEKVPAGEEPVPIVQAAGKVFAHNCPLWTYILAETRLNQEAVITPVTEKLPILTPRLGPVGGRIVAEVFLGLMFGDKKSLLNQCPCWTPTLGAKYALKDFVAYALGK